MEYSNDNPLSSQSKPGGTGMEGAKDPDLWQLAQKRASFKYHLASYILVNSFFWVLWFINGRNYSEGGRFPWPVWPMVGWGIGLAFHFIGAYVFPKSNAVEKEYQKLKNKADRNL